MQAEDDILLVHLAVDPQARWETCRLLISDRVWVNISLKGVTSRLRSNMWDARLHIDACL